MSGPAARLAAALADRYLLERELGQGGMATVYLAHDVKHDTAWRWRSRPSGQVARPIPGSQPGTAT